MKKESYIHVRVSKKTKDKLKEIAKKENRTPTNWIENKIDKYYNKK